MKTDSQEYAKLRGRGFRRGSFFTLSGIRSSLWMGNDHLLCIYHKGYEEDYRRFYFKDIQAVIMHQDTRRRTRNIIYAICALPFAFWGLKLFTVSAIFLLLMLINWLRGPTCSFYVQTAVSRELLPSLNRVKTADEAMLRLSRAVEAVQGRLSAGDMRFETDAPADAGAAGAEGRSRTPLQHYSGNFHTALFYILIFCGVLSCLDHFYNSLALTSLEFLVSCALSIVLVIALVKQHGAAIRPAVRQATWITGGFICAASIIFYVAIMIEIVKSEAAIYTTWDYIKLVSSLSPSDNYLLMGLSILSIIYSFSAGMAGLVFMRRHDDI